MPPHSELALEQIDSWPVPHAAVAVVGPDGTIAKRGDLEYRGRWASVTKLFTAYAVLMAVQDGEFNLDDAYGPDGSTVAHLLAHTSGLPFEGAVAIAEPASKRIYSNRGFDLLGELIEERTGYRYPQYLQVQIAEPLGIETYLSGRPSEGLGGGIEDLAAFARELLQPTLLDLSLYSSATTVAFPGLNGVLPGIGRFDPLDWGLGFELKNGKVPHWTGTRNSPATFGHFGGSGSFLWVDPFQGLALCSLSGREFGDWALDAWPRLSDDVLDQARTK